MIVEIRDCGRAVWRQKVAPPVKYFCVFSKQSMIASNFGDNRKTISHVVHRDIFAFRPCAHRRVDTAAYDRGGDSLVVVTAHRDCHGVNWGEPREASGCKCLETPCSGPSHRVIANRFGVGRRLDLDCRDCLDNPRGLNRSGWDFPSCSLD